jgi:hypothetical protein
MLKKAEINAIAARIIAAIPAVTEHYTVIDDNDFAAKRRDFNLTENQMALVFIRPSSSLRGANLDALRRNHQLTLMVVQGYNRSRGYEEEDRQVDLAIDIVRAIDQLVIQWDGTLDCPVKGFTAVGSIAEPLRDYHDTIGATTTYLIRNNV